MRPIRLGFDGQPVDLTAARHRAVVTKRAIDRWLLVVEDIPRERAREKILNDAVVYGLALGASRVVLGDLSFHLRNGQVITIGGSPA